MLRKSGIQALKALLELAQAPAQWRSAQELAEAQQLPAAMVEQVLLRLRRADVLEARRGRNGGYRLARPARQIVLTEVLAAAAAAPAAGPAGLLEDLLFDLRSAEASLEDDGGLMLG